MNIAEHTQRLREERMNVWQQARAYIDAVSAQGREMNAEDCVTWKRFNDRIDEIDAQVAAQSAAEQRERESAEWRMGNERHFGADRFMSAERDENDTLRRFLRGEPGNWDRSPDTGRPCLTIPVGRARREMEMIRQGASPIEARSLLWDTGNVGSLVPTTLSRTLYQYMEASIAMWRAPTTKIQTSTGEPMQFPRLSSHAIATQVAGQGTALAGTDPGFDHLQLNAYKYGELVGVANEVISDTVIELGEFLGKDMGRAIGRVIDTDLVVGSGTGKPRGIMTALAGNGAGSITTGGSLITPTYEKLVDLAYGIVDEYRQGGSAGWLMRDATTAQLRKLRADVGGTSGPTLWEPSMTSGLIGGQPDRLLGYPVFTDPNVASLASNARTMGFVDYSAYYIRHVNDIVVEQDSSYGFNADMTYFRCKWRLGGDLLDYNAGITLVQNV